MDHAARCPMLSHAEYLDTLVPPSPGTSRRIQDIQLQREEEIDKKYRPFEEHVAATTIQKAYREHRERRQSEGFTLVPSSRWSEAIKELRYRNAIAPHGDSESSHPTSRSRAASDLARLNWRRVAYIAEHAGAGEHSPPREDVDLDSKSNRKLSNFPPSTLMDMRYFLEMVDQKHRYGTNLQVFHEAWLREETDQNFFYWLDRGRGKHLNLPGCSWEKLDKERVRYLSREERSNYLVRVDSDGRLRWEKTNELVTTSVERYEDSMQGIVTRHSTKSILSDEEFRRQLSINDDFANPINKTDTEHPDAFVTKPQLDERPSRSNSESDASSSSSPECDKAHPTAPPNKASKQHLRVSPATILNHLLRAAAKPGTWIYVTDPVGRLYVGIKTTGAFQHASFLSGARISSAGSIGIEDGRLTYLAPLSGHYRPTTKSFRVFIESLKSQGVDLSRLRVSRTYRLLLGVEYYGKTKKGVKKLMHANHDKAEKDTKQSK